MKLQMYSIRQKASRKLLAQTTSVMTLRKKTEIFNKQRIDFIIQKS